MTETAARKAGGGFEAAVRTYFKGNSAIAEGKQTEWRSWFYRQDTGEVLSPHPGPRLV